MAELETKPISKVIQTGQLFGRFYLLEKIGEGATSFIYKALQQPINRIVALKVPDFVVSASLLTPDEFLAEAMAMARLEHQNIVRIYDFGTVEDNAFICMEYLENGSLVDLVEKEGVLSEPLLTALFLQISRGLQYAHSKKVLHRDLSPRNILFGPDGTVKISDFGMSGKKGGTKLRGAILGTPAFLSPEHVQKLPCTPKSDWFSFSSLIYYAATGKLLFDPSKQDAEELFNAIKTGRDTPPAKALTELPEPFASIALKGLKGEEVDSIPDVLEEHWKGLSLNQKPEFVILENLGEVSDEHIKSRYLSLRKEGKHQQAVQLLENALESAPFNHEIRRLLSEPWNESKSSSPFQTLEVQEPHSKALSNSSNHKGRRGYSFIALSITLLAIGLIYVYQTFDFNWVNRNDSISSSKATSPSQMELPERNILFKPQNTPGIPREKTVEKPVANQFIPPVAKKVVQDPPAKTTAVKQPTNQPANSSSKISNSPESNHSVKPQKNLSFLNVEGPAGIKIRLNDTLTLVSPPPQDGWKVNPGIASILMTHPEKTSAITSTIFLEQGVRYTIRFPDEGGYALKKDRP